MPIDNETLGAAVAIAKANPASEQAITNAVNDWLDDHPEATTTVQDGSITKVKLDNNLQVKVDELDSVKSAIESLDGGTTGQVLRKKSNTDKDFEWASVAQPTDAQVDSAVEGWLDDHPEATTTVLDGSLTEEKFSDATLRAMKNGYVTPEMFGAKGDGITDDATAFQQMFASDNTFFYIPKKTYVIGNSVDIEKAECTVQFNNTTFKPIDAHGDVNTYEYLIGLKARDIKIYGHFTLSCYHWINIGLWLSSCGGSFIDSVAVEGARLWGICMDNNSYGNNSLFFRKILCSQCGYKLTAKAKYKETNVFELSNISERLFNTLTLSAKRSCFNNAYNSAEYVIDDSGYTKQYLANRAVYKSSLADTGEAFVINDDGTTGTFTMGSGVGWLRPSADFVDGNDGRNVFIPVGGAVKFGSSSSEGVFTIVSFVSGSNPISFHNDMGYGGKIGSYSTEFDSIVMTMGISFDVDIGYMYAEGVGNGMAYNNDNRRIFLITQNDYTFVNVHAPFHGQGRLNFFQHNQVVLNAQLSGPAAPSAVLFSTDTTIKQAQAFNYGLGVGTFYATVTEHSPSTITAITNGFNATRTFIIDLIDKNAKNVNNFAPVVAYIKCTNKTVTTPVKVIFGSGMTDAGYSINGAVDNVLSIDMAEYDYSAKITFMLFKKTFYVTAEPIVFVDNTDES